MVAGNFSQPGCSASIDWADDPPATEQRRDCLHRQSSIWSFKVIDEENNVAN
jgi:hypothetical protein